MLRDPLLIGDHDRLLVRAARHVDQTREAEVILRSHAVAVAIGKVARIEKSGRNPVLRLTDQHRLDFISPIENLREAQPPLTTLRGGRKAAVEHGSFRGLIGHDQRHDAERLAAHDDGVDDFLTRFFTVKP